MRKYAHTRVYAYNGDKSPQIKTRREIAMPTSGRVSLLSAVENLVDMLINAASFAMAFVLSVLFAGPGELTLDSPVILISTFIIVVIQSFVYVAFNLYRPIPFVKTHAIVWNLIRVNFGFFGLLEAIVAVFVSPESKQFVAIWVLVTFVISTALLVFKKNIIILVVNTQIIFHFIKCNYHLSTSHKRE